MTERNGCEGYFSICFDAESCETVTSIITNKLGRAQGRTGFIVMVTPVQGAPFEAEIVDGEWPDDEDLWESEGQPLTVRRYSRESNRPFGGPEVVFAESIHVY